mmetsp:Transcript_108260/g.312875  ORF Transcript_108260/g.312875 Transcript_108260/m.312875 type:complete len:346 (-) Transcript_108260:717-1754(-)
MCQALLGRWPIPRLGCEQLGNEVLGLVRAMLKALKVHLALGVPHKHLFQGLTPEGAIPCQQNVHQDPDTEAVHLATIALALQNLWRDIAGSSASSQHGHEVPLGGRQPEIDELHLVGIAGLADILGLDVPVYDAANMQKVERGEQLPHNVQDPGLGQWPVLSHLLEKLSAANELCDDRPRSLPCGRLIDLVNGAELQDALVQRPSQDSRLLEQGDVVFQRLLAHDLHRDLLSGGAVLGQEHLRARADADQLADTVPQADVVHDASCELQLLQQVLLVICGLAHDQPTSRGVVVPRLVAQSQRLQGQQLLGRRRSNDGYAGDALAVSFSSRGGSSTSASTVATKRR